MLLHEKLSAFNIILASKSPRRRDLMTQANIPFTLAKDFDVDEVFPDNILPENVAEYLSELKSEGYPFNLDLKDIIITCDTVVICDHEVLGKPSDREDAMNILKKLSGKKHKVITGVTIRDIHKKKSFSVESDVFFRNLEAEEIKYYVDNYSPMDKAGAYGIQEWIGCIGIEKIEGSFYNVMGLPIQTLYCKLNKFVSR